ncbi:MAG: FAD-dependent oxidoreductase [Chloroflexi bacterium]|nr:FAD-dependent oxidoreductase [Chloroflexota bacterium]
MNKRIDSLAALDDIKRRVKPLLLVRQDTDSTRIKSASQIDVLVCRGTGCTAAGAGEVEEAFRSAIKKKGLGDRVRVTVTKIGCRGFCERGPNVTVTPGDILYTRVRAGDVDEIVDKHLIGGEVVQRLIYTDPISGKHVAANHEIPFYQKQRREVLFLNGLIDPWSIDEYIANDGYRAVVRALTEMKPDDVLQEVTKSGLRGRGGAGFPTGRKWSFVRGAAGDEKYVVCNGDEGDPGAFMNRSVLEGNPHSVVEGMLIGAYAIGNVKHGYCYVRAEYPLAIETLGQAIKDAREYGLLGNNILGTGFSFDIDIFPGAGAFVCGEETALLISLEGKRGNPRQRPPFPANKGLFDKPTTLNNVETWSIVPRIILKGSDWYKSIGATGNAGTKTFCLVGKISNSGIAEVPVGTPLGYLVFDIGGGPPGGKKFKAVQIGGPSGGMIPIEHINTPVDYESITNLGAIMGSGGLIVMDEDSCMVDMAKFFLEFTKDESCGKCVPCRAGIPKMLEILHKITRGQASMEDLAVLQELAEMVGSASLCGLGQTAPNPVLSSLRHFRAEYEAHIIDKKCPAAVCAALFRAPCQHTCPVGLDIPGYVAFIKEGRFEDSYKLIKQRNPFPSVCGRVCHHPCEGKCRRGQTDDPVAIRHLKRFAADWADDAGVRYVLPSKSQRPEKVAVIGAGPAGLSAAHDLAVEGYQVVVFEALPVAGGMLAVGIPEYRLPKEVLKREIADIEKLGVEIRLNTRVDNVESLFGDGYKAVYAAVGAHSGDKMKIPGEELNGVYDAVEFLRDANLGRNVKVGSRVAIVGGGNTAFDSARVALRLGAHEAHVFYRRERGDMPAQEEEILAAEEEGVHVHLLVAPTRIVGRNGSVSGLELVRMELGEFDKSGRKTPHTVAGSEHTVPCDTIIEAIGQRPDASFLASSGVKLGRGGTVMANARTLATDRPGVFAGGDAVTGPQTAIEAIAAGQRAASSIKRYLQGRDLEPRMEREDVESFQLPVAVDAGDIKETPRVAIKELPLTKRGASFAEVTADYSAQEATAEAGRCLRCDAEVGGE